VPAGGVREEALQAGEAVRIMTGAPLLPGADTVVILEEARRRDGCLIVDHPVPKGRHIRRQGEDVERGRTVIPVGKRIRPAEVALLASLGIFRVKIFRPPRVAILVTGNELIGADQPLKSGAIRDSNSWALEGYLSLMGLPVLNCGVVPDGERPLPVLQHLEELRKRLWVGLGAVVLGTTASFAWVGRILAWLKKPAEVALP